jgi:hypothetical protein
MGHDIDDNTNALPSQVDTSGPSTVFSDEGSGSNTSFDSDDSIHHPLGDWHDFTEYLGACATDSTCQENANAWPSEDNMVSDHSSEWVTPSEPTPELGRNGLPAFHTCHHCQHIVIGSRLLREAQQIPLCDGRSDMVKAREDGCPFFCWLEWKCYWLFADLCDTTRNYFKFAFAVKAKPSTPFAIDYISLKHWTLDMLGDYRTQSDNYYFAVAGKGTFLPPFHQHLDLLVSTALITRRRSGCTIYIQKASQSTSEFHREF